MISEKSEKRTSQPSSSHHYKNETARSIEQQYQSNLNILNNKSYCRNNNSSYISYNNFDDSRNYRIETLKNHHYYSEFQSPLKSPSKRLFNLKMNHHDEQEQYQNYQNKKEDSFFELTSREVIHMFHSSFIKERTNLYFAKMKMNNRINRVGSATCLRKPTSKKKNKEQKEPIIKKSLSTINLFRPKSSVNSRFNFISEDNEKNKKIRKFISKLNRNIVQFKQVPFYRHIKKDVQIQKKKNFIKHLHDKEQQFEKKTLQDVFEIEKWATVDNNMDRDYYHEAQLAFKIMIETKVKKKDNEEPTMTNNNINTYKNQLLKKQSSVHQFPFLNLKDKNLKHKLIFPICKMKEEEHKNILSINKHFLNNLTNQIKKIEDIQNKYNTKDNINSSPIKKKRKNSYFGYDTYINARNKSRIEKQSNGT